MYPIPFVANMFLILPAVPTGMVNEVRFFLVFLVMVVVFVFDFDLVFVFVLGSAIVVGKLSPKPESMDASVAV